MRLPHMAFILLIAAALLLAWHVFFDTASPHPRLMEGMTARPATSALTRTSPPGTVPYGELPPAPPASTLFARHCAACHGADGRGSSYVASREGMPSVSDLSNNPAPAAQKRESLLKGRGAMPAFGKRLGAAELEVLHAHILSLNPAQP